MNATIKVPDLGSDSSVEVIEVHTKAGDVITATSLVVTLESDKATMEIEAEQAGVVEKILVKPGDKVKTGDLLLELAAAAKEKEKEKIQKETVKTPTAPTSEAVLDEVLPDIGTDASVEVIEIAVKVGDSIEKEKTLLTLESDKATMEIPASQSGVIQELRIKVGDKVKSGDVIATLKVADVTSQPEAVKEESKKSQTIKESLSAEKNIKASNEKPQVSQSSPQSSLFKGPSREVHAGPAVRKMARMMRVDLAEVAGSGPKGRILKEDVESFVAKVMDTKRQGGGQGFPAVRTVDYAAFGPIEEIALNKIKRLTAKNMSAAWVHVPHVTQFDEADISELDEFRNKLKTEANEKGIKLTFMAFLLKATAKALQDWPRFNSSLGSDGGTLILKQYIHIGIAVDTPNGLVVPVVKDVDKKGVMQLAEELMEISEKARVGKLMPKDMQGAGFTISSLGGIGGTQFTPIVNAPEVAILGVSRAKMQPVYLNGSFEPRLMLPLALSYDHRVVDGAEAARFTRSLANYLEDYRRMIL